MEAKCSVPCRSDVCAIICFLCLERVGGNEIYLCLCNVFGGHNIMSKCAAYRWIEKFKAGSGIMEN